MVCFLYFWLFFQAAPNFSGIKPLYHHFWKFCLLELMNDINRNLFMPLSSNSDAFRSPKKSVSKFDDFDCPQLYGLGTQIFELAATTIRDWDHLGWENKQPGSFRDPCTEDLGVKPCCNGLADHLHPLWHTRRTRGKTLAASDLVSPQPARTG